MSYIMKDGVIYEVNFDDSGNYALGDVHETGAEDVIASEARQFAVDKSFYAGNSGDISIEEVYNQLILTCDCDDIDDVISSPFNDDDIYSVYPCKQHYLNEYVCWGEGKTACYAFLDIVHGRGTDYDAAETHCWYMQLMQNKNWTFNLDKYIRTDGKYQATVPKYLYSKGSVNSCAMLSLGKIKKTSPGNDNTITNEFEMNNYIVISLIGRGELEGEETYPKHSEFYKYAPAATYTGNIASGRYSPTDAITHNYFIFSGKIGLSRRGFVTKRWHSLKSVNDRDGIWHACVHLDNSKNGDGAYYATQFFDNPNCNDSTDTEWDADTSFIMPLNEDWKDLTQAQYTESSGDIDNIYYVPMLMCEMKIGEYYLVETYNGNSNFPTYYWAHQDNLPMFTDANGHQRHQTFFSLGVNPAYGDYIVGKQYDIANMISPDMGIEDEEGIAVDIPYDLNLTGKIEFKILGPAWIQSVDGVLTYHKEWQTGYYYNDDGSVTEYQYLATVQDNATPYKYADSMWIQDFNVKVVSDNGGISNTDDDKDLVYETATNPNGQYINILDDLEFMISTQLTTAEALAKGITQTVKINNPSLVSDNSALRSVYNTVTGETAKPEEHYLDHYWNEYQKPKILFTTEFRDTPQRSWTTHYTFNQWSDKEFFVQSESYDVKYCKKELVLKEL